MLCRVDASSLKALFFALLALAALVTPATSQIHWNRGWGAGGSLGKRSSSSASSPSLPDDSEVVSIEDCSSDLAQITSSLARIIMSESYRVAACEARNRLASSSLSSSDPDHMTAHLAWWLQAARKEAAAPDQ